MYIFIQIHPDARDRDPPCDVSLVVCLQGAGRLTGADKQNTYELNLVNPMV